MYQHVISAHILLAIGVAMMIISLVLGWISFAVPDWLQYYEQQMPSRSTDNNLSTNENSYDLIKFGLWYRCIFSVIANDFNCASWNSHVPSFVRVIQVFIPFGLSLGCASLLSAFIGFLSRRAFVTAVLISCLFAFLNFVFSTIGVTVFASESVVYVDRLRISLNESPRRWGMWLIIPHLVLVFLASIFFLIASILNWSNDRQMQVTGILSHSIEKYGDNVYKAPSESNMMSPIKRPPHLQDYPNAYQVNGYQNNQTQPFQYPSTPNYPSNSNPTYPGLFGYSRPASPTMNPMYPNGNFDSYFHRNHMTEFPEIEDPPRGSRSHHHSHSRRHSSHRSRSRSPHDTSSTSDNPVKQTQFIPIPVPYYQPTAPNAQPSTMNAPNNPNPTLSYLMPQINQQHVDENSRQTNKTNNVISYSNGQPTVLSTNPNQPVYTIAYRPNTTGNIFGTNVISGPAAATYVTASRNSVTGFLSDNEDDERYNRLSLKNDQLRKIKIDESWAWRRL